MCGIKKIKRDCPLYKSKALNKKIRHSSLQTKRIEDI